MTGPHSWVSRTDPGRFDHALGHVGFVPCGEQSRDKIVEMGQSDVLVNLVARKNGRSPVFGQIGNSEPFGAGGAGGTDLFAGKGDRADSWFDATEQGTRHLGHAA